MLGIGGGLVMVPALTMMFAAQAGFPPAEMLHMALGTSMATILFTSLSSLHAHHKHGAVLWPVVYQITPGILLGTGRDVFCREHTGPAAGDLFYRVCLLRCRADDHESQTQAVA